jgi:hypothetical protein
VETSKDADMPRKPLTLVAQLPEFPQLDLAQRRPTAEEKRHTLITIVPRISQLVVVEQSEVRWKVLDHLGATLSGPTRRRRKAPRPASCRVVLATTSGSSRPSYA